MSRVHILVEGQTEEIFVQEVLAPNLSHRNVFVSPKIVTTKRLKRGSHFKGGVVSYLKVKNDVKQLLYDTDVAMVTTMLDFYGLPNDFPGYSTLPTGTCYERAAHLEAAFAKDIGSARFLPYLSIHEFEALLFTDTTLICTILAKANASHRLEAIKAKVASPEEIDEDEPPSQRILSEFPEYAKVVDGPVIAQEIGLKKLRESCGHVGEWLGKLEALGEM